MEIFQIMGALGLLMITIGVLIKDRKKEDILYIFGGIFLESYSLSIKDPIFITLQIIFILAAGYDLYTLKK